MQVNRTHADAVVLKALIGFGTLVGAAAAVFFSEVAFAFACDGPDPCHGFSDPMKMRTFAWLMLGGVLVSVVLARLRQRTATVVAALLTTVVFVVWLSLFVYIVEGKL